MKKTFLKLVAVIIFFTACNNSQKTDKNSYFIESETNSETSANEAIIHITSADDMKFNLTEIKVKEGQTVKLTLQHTGSFPKNVMGHNFVLLKNSVSFENFVAEAMNAKDNDYIPIAMQDDVIAHTKIIGGGESDVIEFTAPEKGTYDFLCSYPGHASMMKGKFTVE